MDFFNLVQSLSTDALPQMLQVAPSGLEARLSVNPSETHSASPFAALLDVISTDVGAVEVQTSEAKSSLPQGVGTVLANLSIDTVSDADPPEQPLQSISAIDDPDTPLPYRTLPVGTVLPLFPTAADNPPGRVEEMNVSVQAEGGNKPREQPAVFGSSHFGPSGTRKGPEPKGDDEHLVREPAESKIAKPVAEELFARPLRRHTLEQAPASHSASQSARQSASQSASQLASQFVRIGEQASDLTNGTDRMRNRNVALPIDSSERQVPVRAMQNIEASVRQLEVVPPSQRPFRDVLDKGDTHAGLTPDTALYATDGTHSAVRTISTSITTATVAPQTPVLSSIDQLPEQINMMLSRRAASATLHVEFEDLGRVEIKVRMDSDLAHVNFTVQSSAREAIESYLPRLRALLEDSGLTLGDVDVSTSNEEDNQRKPSTTADERHRRDVNPDSEAGEHHAMQTMKTRTSRQIIDAFV